MLRKKPSDLTNWVNTFSRILRPIWLSHWTRWFKPSWTKDYIQFLKSSSRGSYPNKNDIADVSCHRPTSHLCCNSKVLEQLVSNALFDNVKTKPHDNQFGFRTKRSAIQQLITFMENVYGSLDCNTKKVVVILHLDISEGFDKCPHWQCFEKVEETLVETCHKSLDHTSQFDFNKWKSTPTTLKNSWLLVVCPKGPYWSLYYF